MQGNSRIVTSNQQSMHPDLEQVVRKHLSHRYQRPFKPVSLEAFDGLQRLADAHGGPIIFDSGCGTGESVLALAKQHPRALVMGFDKSAARIGKAERRSDDTQNSIQVRADAVDIWRLANRAGWRLQRHYLLYPNPWPKKQHLQRRWHAHPVFKDLLNLGGKLHLRSNWRIYVDEFAQAVKFATGQERTMKLVQEVTPISAFEKKYRNSGQDLFEYVVAL